MISAEIYLVFTLCRALLWGHRSINEAQALFWKCSESCREERPRGWTDETAETGVGQAIATLFSNGRLRSFHSFLLDVEDCLKFLKQGITMTRNRLWVKWQKDCPDHPLRVKRASLLTQVALSHSSITWTKPSLRQWAVQVQKYHVLTSL